MSRTKDNQVPNHPPLARGHGFTLIELLVVIALILVIAGIGLVGLDQFRGVGDVNSAVNTISASLKITQTLAGRPIPDVSVVCDDYDALGCDGAADANRCGYSGVAMLFTPYGEIRLVENDQLAQNAFQMTSGSSFDFPEGAFLEQICMPAPCGPNIQDKAPPINGYRDIEGIDYIRMPKNVGVIGVDRQTAQVLELMNPPFAIYVTPEGFVMPSSRNGDVARSLWVHYDGNYDGKISLAYTYDLGEGCPAQTYSDVPPRAGMWRDNAYNHDGSATPAEGDPYDIREWDPDSPDYKPAPPTSDGPGRDPVTNKYRLPFETIECVIGILVYSKEEMRKAGFDRIRDTDTWNWNESGGHVGRYRPSQQWVLENSRAVWFNRYSGVANRRSGG